MKPRYTPGPWFVVNRGRDLEITPERKVFYADTDYNEVKDRMPSAGSGLVAVVHVSKSGAKRGQPVHYYPRSSDKANAYLIAFAPELFEHLAAVTAIMKSELPWPDAHFDTINRAVALLNNLKPLIFTP